MTGSLPPCLVAAGDGCVLHVAVVPGARRTGADGLHDNCLRVRLVAPPVDGKANEALLAWLAGELGLPKRAVRLLRGQSARRKQVELDLARPRRPTGSRVSWLLNDETICKYGE